MGRPTINELLEQARARLDRLDPPAAQAAAAAGDAILVDIRSEFHRERHGAIPGAVWHPRNVLEWRMDPASGYDDPRISSDPDARIVVVCQQGYQSSLVAATLQDLGFPRATDLAGGFEAWLAMGLPIETSPTSIDLVREGRPLTDGRTPSRVDPESSSLAD